MKNKHKHALTKHFHKGKTDQEIAEALNVRYNTNYTPKDVKQARYDNELIRPQEKKLGIIAKSSIGLAALTTVIAAGLQLGKSEEPKPKQQATYEAPVPPGTLAQHQHWMSKYDSKGVDYKTLFNKEPIKSTLEKTEQETTDLGKQVLDFLQGDKRYEDFKAAHLPFWVYGRKQREADIHRFIENATLTGMDEIEAYARKNYKTLTALDDDKLSTWALNAAYFITRKNFKSSINSTYTAAFNNIHDAHRAQQGDCELNTVLTMRVYFNIINALNKPELADNLQDVSGFLLDQHDGVYRWLLFKRQDGVAFIETNDPRDDALIKQAYNPDKNYTRMAGLGLYVPIAQTTYYPQGDTVTSKTTINLLPKELR